MSVSFHLHSKMRRRQNTDSTDIDLEVPTDPYVQVRTWPFDCLTCMLHLQPDLYLYHLFSLFFFFPPINLFFCRYLLLRVTLLCSLRFLYPFLLSFQDNVMQFRTCFFSHCRPLCVVGLCVLYWIVSFLLHRGIESTGRDNFLNKKSHWKMFCSVLPHMHLIVDRFYSLHFIFSLIYLFIYLFTELFIYFSYKLERKDIAHIRLVVPENARASSMMKENGLSGN